MQKITLGVFVTCALFAQSVNAQITKVVNGASLAGAAVAPGSIITVLGAKLGTATASLTDARNLPLTLGGVTLTVGGLPAALFYVSPTQVNARIDPKVAVGLADVTLTSPAGTFSSKVNVAAAAPGLFSLNGSGVGDGAIIHALTFAITAFSPRSGSGPTFLSLFGTGLNLSAPTVVRIAGVPVPVLFAGEVLPAGLQQINVQLVDSLAGAGRVSVVVESGGVGSNIVEIVLLPAKGNRMFPSDDDNQTRSREISDLAWVPNTSLVLVTDENDDVVRVADLRLKSIVRTIVLPSGANPVAVSVNADGSTAVVVERDRAKVALIDLAKNTVSAEVAVGRGPVAAAIAASTVIVPNQQDNTVSVFFLQSQQQVFTVPVGKSPRGVALNATGTRAWVTNQDSGTISVMDLTTRAVTDTITLPAGAHPQAIQLVNPTATQTVAVVSDPSAGPDGRLYFIDIATKQLVTVNANPDHSGGAADIAVSGNTVFAANQAAGTVTFGAVSLTAFTPSTVRAGMGVRALAVDTLDKLLVVANQGSGTLNLIDLTTNQSVGQIDVVRTSDDDDDDHGDRDRGANLPVVTSVAPAAGKAGTTFTLTINGTGLTGASDVIFLDPAMIPGKGHGHGKGADDNQTHGPFGSRDAGFTVSQMAVNAAGTQMTVQVQVAANHAAATRIVRVLTPNGESSLIAASGNTFAVTQ